MNSVEAAGFFFGEAHGFDGDDFEAGFVNARKDFTLLAAADGVRFDDCECTFDGHEKIPPTGLREIRRQDAGATKEPG
jgi:hypothetical protein